VHVIESGQEKLKHSTIEKTLFVPSKKLNCCFSADRTGQPATDAPRNQSHAQTSTSGQPKKSHKFWRVGKAVKAVSRLFGMSVHATPINDSQGVTYTSVSSCAFCMFDSFGIIYSLSCFPVFSLERQRPGHRLPNRCEACGTYWVGWPLH
jgi:hypothetical protein